MALVQVRALVWTPEAQSFRRYLTEDRTAGPGGLLTWVVTSAVPEAGMTTLGGHHSAGSESAGLWYAAAGMLEAVHDEEAPAGVAKGIRGRSSMDHPAAGILAGDAPEARNGVEDLIPDLVWPSSAGARRPGGQAPAPSPSARALSPCPSRRLVAAAAVAVSPSSGAPTRFPGKDATDERRLDDESHQTETRRPFEAAESAGLVALVRARGIQRIASELAKVVRLAT